MGSDSITIQQQIEMARIYANVSKTELAKALGYSPQALYQRLKTGKFTKDELETIGKTFGAEFTMSFKFPDGTEF